MMKFITHFAEDKARKLSARVDDLLAAAIIMHENGNRARAAEFRRTVLDLNPDAAEKTDRLMPGY